MIIKFDWLSFTLDVGAGEERESWRMPEIIRDALDALDNRLVGWLGLAGECVPRVGRKPYSMGWEVVGGFVYVFAHPRLSHVLIEITGQGCEKLREKDCFEGVLVAALPRLTRLDIASDILTDTSPLDFASARDNARFKSHSEFVSASGTTAYVGSRTSDRYARVYRYNPPHERSQFLRIEHVLKGNNAKIAAAEYLQSGLDTLQFRVGAVFDWRHADWTIGGGSAAALSAWRPERHEGKTLFWLASQVEPVLVRLHREGSIDIETWAKTLLDRAVANSRIQ